MPDIALVKPRDNGRNTARHFLLVIPFFPSSALSMLETVVKPAVCHAGAKHSTGSTLKYSTCDMNPCPAFRTTSGVTSSRKLASVKRRAGKSSPFFSASRHLRVLSANHVDSGDRKKARRAYLAMTPHAQSRVPAY